MQGQNQARISVQDEFRLSSALTLEGYMKLNPAMNADEVDTLVAIWPTLCKRLLLDNPVHSHRQKAITHCTSRVLSDQLDYYLAKRITRDPELELSKEAIIDSIILKPSKAWGFFDGADKLHSLLLKQNKKRNKTYFSPVCDLGAAQLWIEAGDWWVQFADVVYKVNIDFVLLLHLKYEETALALLTAALDSGISMPDDFGLGVCPKIERLLLIFCEIMVDLKNEGYAVMKAFEGLCNAKIVMKFDSVQDDEYMRALLQDLEDCDLRISPYVHNLVDFLDNFNEEELFNVQALYKSMGYPLIRMSEGAQKQIRKMQQPDEPNQCFQNLFLAYCIKSFCTRHFQKMKCWPAVSVHPDCHPTLVRAFAEKRGPQDPIFKQGNIQTYHWFDVFVEKSDKYHFEVPSHFIDLLSDKAIALTCSAAYQKYIHNEQIPFADKRLLTKWCLSTNLTDELKKYIWDTEDSVNEICDLVIKATPKEKELKDRARWFASNTLHERIMKQVIELNSKKMKSVFDNESTMVMTNLAILKKIYSMHSLKDTQSIYQVGTIMIDTSSWCLGHMDGNSTAPLHQTWGGFMGTSCYDSFMKKFEATDFYFPTFTDTTETIQAKTKPSSTGMEGLHQYSWEAVYARLITWVLEDLGIKHIFIVRGDDARVACLFPKAMSRDEVRRQLLEIKKKIAIRLEEWGHKVNLQESFVSMDFFSFNKIYLYRQAKMPHTMKKCIKISPHENSVVETMENGISNIFSGGFAAATVSAVPVVPYTVALVQALRVFCDMLNYTEDSQMDYLLLQALVQFPSVLGGTPVCLFQHYIVTAENDHLTQWLSYYQHLMRSRAPVWDYLHRVLQQEFSDDPSPIQLVSDISSLPLRIPARPDAYLKKEMHSAISNYATEESILSLFRAYDHDSQKRICIDLLAGTPCFPKILNIIFKSTPVATVDKLLKSFTSARTMYQFLQDMTGQARSIFRKASRLERQRRKWICNLLTQENFLPPMVDLNSNVLTQDVRDLREAVWGRKMVGNTYPPPQDVFHSWGRRQNYVEKRRAGEFTDEEWKHITTNHITIKVNEAAAIKAQTSSRHLHFSTGKSSPFIGKVTKDKFDNPIEVSASSSEHVRGLSDVFRVFCYANQQGSNSVDYVFKAVLLSWGFTLMIINMIISMLPVAIRGSSTHRLTGDRWKEQTLPNHLHNLESMYYGATDTCAEFLTKVGGRWPINFLYLKVICGMMSLFSMFTGHYSLKAEEDEFWFVMTFHPKEIFEDLKDDPITFPKRLILDTRCGEALKFTGTEIEEVLDMVKELEGKEIRMEMRRLNLNVLGSPEAAVQMYSALLARRLTRDHIDYRRLIQEEYEIKDPSFETTASALLGVDHPEHNITNIRCISADVWGQALMQELSEWLWSTTQTDDPVILRNHVKSLKDKELPGMTLLQALNEASMTPSVIAYFVKQGYVPKTSSDNSQLMASLLTFIAGRPVMERPPQLLICGEFQAQAIKDRLMILLPRVLMSSPCSVSDELRALSPESPWEAMIKYVAFHLVYPLDLVLLQYIRICYGRLGMIEDYHPEENQVYDVRMNRALDEWTALSSLSHSFRQWLIHAGLTVEHTTWLCQVVSGCCSEESESVFWENFSGDLEDFVFGLQLDIIVGDICELQSVLRDIWDNNRRVLKAPTSMMMNDFSIIANLGQLSVMSTDHSTVTTEVPQDLPFFVEVDDPPSVYVRPTMALRAEGSSVTSASKLSDMDHIVGINRMLGDSAKMMICCDGRCGWGGYMCHGKSSRFFMAITKPDEQAGKRNTYHAVLSEATAWGVSNYNSRAMYEYPGDHCHPEFLMLWDGFLQREYSFGSTDMDWTSGQDDEENYALAMRNNLVINIVKGLPNSWYVAKTFIPRSRKDWKGLSKFLGLVFTAYKKVIIVRLATTHIMSSELYLIAHQLVAELSVEDCLRIYDNQRINNEVLYQLKTLIDDVNTEVLNYATHNIVPARIVSRLGRQPPSEMRMRGILDNLGVLSETFPTLAQLAEEIQDRVINLCEMNYLRKYSQRAKRDTWSEIITTWWMIDLVRETSTLPLESVIQRSKQQFRDLTETDHLFRRVIEFYSHHLKVSYQSMVRRIFRNADTSAWTYRYYVDDRLRDSEFDLTKSFIQSQIDQYFKVKEGANIVQDFGELSLV